MFSRKQRCKASFLVLWTMYCSFDYCFVYMYTFALHFSTRIVCCACCPPMPFIYCLCLQTLWIWTWSKKQNKKRTHNSIDQINAVTRHLHTWWNATYKLDRIENEWIKRERLDDVSITRHTIFFIQYIQKPLTSSNVKSIHKWNSPEKRLFHILRNTPRCSVSLSFPCRFYRSLCYFIFKQICLEKFSVHLCLYKNTRSFKCKQVYKKKDWMHEPEAMRAKGEMNIQLYLLVVVFFFPFLPMFTI